MGRFGFQTPSPIHQSPARDGAASIIGMEHSTAKCTVPKGAVEQRLDERPLDLEWGLFFSHAFQRLRLANAREGLVFRQPETNDSSKVSIRKRPDRRLRIGQVALNRLALDYMGNEGLKREVASRLD